MTITILPPIVEDTHKILQANSNTAEDDDAMSMDFEDGGVEMAIREIAESTEGKRPSHGDGDLNTAGIVTPGEIVTDDPQWMRSVSSYLSEDRF